MQASCAVISAIGGYEAEVIRPFVESVLCRSRADLHLLDLPRQPLPGWLARLAAQPRVHLHVGPAITPSRSLSVLRFAWIEQLLPSIQADQVLLCDSRDALLQADPFIASQPPGADASFLWLAQEERTLGACGINMGWLRRDGSPEEAAAIQHRPILCAGTILGSRDQLARALRALVSRIKGRLPSLETPVPWALDQSSLNLLAWQNQLGVPFTARGNHDGFALTLHHGEQLSLDRQGRMLLGNGQVAPIVHQYDRIPWLAKHLQSQLSW